MTACMAIKPASRMHIGLMIWRFMASATRAARRCTPSLCIAFSIRLATVPGVICIRRAISLAVMP
ncbi:hypothetical protein D3C79_1120260 [compost metagenome]